MRLFLLALCFFGISGIAQAQSADDFVFEIDNTNTLNRDLAFKLVTTGAVQISWGNGQTSTYSSSPSTSVASHPYATRGVFTVTVSGTINSFEFYFARRTPLNIKQWGTNQWQTMYRAFAGVENLTFSATDIPDFSQLTDLSQMFYQVNNFNSNISNWDVSTVTNMDSLFLRVPNFNQPLNGWDVSNVANMSQVFGGCTAFNQPLTNWDVSSATSLSLMFSDARSFNQPLNMWDVSSVTSMFGMFLGASVFNQPLDGWNVSNVQSFTQMFSFAHAFNQPLNNWNTSSVTSMNAMFKNTNLFNQPLNNWDVSNVINMSEMFSGALLFNQSLIDWNFATLVDKWSMFEGATSFNQNIALWDFKKYRSESMVANSGLDVENYDRLLEKFVFMNFTNQNSTATNLEYCNDFARNQLIQRNWNFTGDSKAASCPDNIVSGHIQLDVTNNGCDSADPPGSNIRLLIANNTASITVFTDSQGFYDVNLVDGNFTITPTVDSTVYISNPASVSLNLTNGSSASADFCLGSATLINDLEITVLPLEDPRPGFDVNYKLIFKNKGNTELSGIVNLTYEEDYMDFLNSNPATTSSSVGSLNWAFTTLVPLETREISFSMNLNTPTDANYPLNSNDIINFSATVTHTGTEATPADNVFDLQQTVVNSYDPNDKTNLNGNTLDPSKVGDYVHYRIRFENEGTASAVNVRIIDYIDLAKFDIETLVPLSGSHDFTTTISQGNKVEFKFDNIMLPFTAPASQGYVLFKIKTKSTLVLGDDFSNEAEIYFDFNFPIYTNLETTLVALSTASISDTKLFDVKLYPNPATNKVTVSSNTTFNRLVVYDAVGKQVVSYALTSPALSHAIPLESLASGMYFVEITGNEGAVVEKLLKQ